MAFNRPNQSVRFSNEVRLRYENKRVYIELGKKKIDNIIILKDKLEYEARNLSDNKIGNKGSHSILLRLFNPDNDQETPLVLKICAYSNNSKEDWNVKNLFKREILALKTAKERGCKKIISMMESGELFIEGRSHGYYVMEYADNDLANYLLNEVLEFNQKVLICYDLLLGLKELHDAGVYHRDIKHDNLLMCGEECKLADLGLAKFQNEDDIELKKRIGAYGWEAPEAINKYYVERDGVPYNYIPEDDCIVDNKSDVYQIAKVFWYVFNRRIPIGQIVMDDFIDNDCTKEDKELLFDAIHKMLLQNKKQRMSIEEAVTLFRPLANRI